MQTKRYARNVEETIAAGAAFNVGEILNNLNRRANYHGIRVRGRLRADNASADNEAHGLIALFCTNSQLGITESQVDSDTNLQDLSEEIVAICPWSVFGGSTNPVGEGTIFDYEFVIKSSRTCARGQELRLVIFNHTESAKSVINAMSLLSCFETTV